MNAGELRTKIRIQYAKKTGSGSFAKEEWVDIGGQSAADEPRYIFAKWVNVHGSEAWIAASVQAQRAATVTIRFNERVNEAYRVLLGDMVYSIVSLDNIRQTGQWLEIKVKAAVNG